MSTYNLHMQSPTLEMRLTHKFDLLKPRGLWMSMKVVATHST
jgi:hypothetical protein